MVVLIVLCLPVKLFVFFAPSVCFHILVKGPHVSQPPVCERLLPLLRQVIQVETIYCAASVIFIVLLIIPKTISVCIKCSKINLRYGHMYVWLPVLQGSIYQLFTGSSHSQSNQLSDF